MDHGPYVEWKDDKSVVYKTRTGIVLFVVYCLVYTGFIVINTFTPGLMETIVFLGLNLAVVYGFGLIITAILMGIVYNYLCTRMENRVNRVDGGEK
ncbi:MAG: DUF485 domain-containing protein [Spirochaetota bacterium]